MPVDCCTKTYDLGCIECGAQSIELPVNAAMDGTYVALFRYLGRTIRFEFTGTTGEPLVVLASGLNERFVFVFHVLDPNGDQVAFGEYDCFSIRVIPCAIEGEEPDPDDCDLCDLLAEVEAADVVADVWDCLTPEAQAALNEYLGAVANVIIRYADLATAQAAVVIPTAHQFVLIEDTGDMYPGNGTDDVPALITAAKFLLGVTKNTKGFNVGFDGTPEANSLQLNEPLTP